MAIASATLQLLALILAVLAVQVVPQSGTTTSCHADLLVKGINFAAMSPQVQQQVGQAVSQKISLETGMAQQDVMSKVLAGNYNAPWSPSAGRPPADAFVASLVRECQSAEMILGVFRGPQLQAAVVEALKSSLANTNALSGAISIIGASVVPEKLVTTTHAPGLPIPQPGTGGGAALPALPEAKPAASAPASVETDATLQRQAAPAGPGSGWLFIGIGVLLLAACSVPMIISKIKQSQEDDDEDQYAFTGH
jgi:hypothetical protein